MIRIAPAKSHAQAGRILSKLQTHFEHIGEVSYLTLTNEIKIQGNTRRLPHKARSVRVDDARIP
jgi:arginine utilization protein RocB